MGMVPDSIFHGKHAADNIVMLHALRDYDMLMPKSIFIVLTLFGVYYIFRALRKKEAWDITSSTLLTVVSLFLMLDSCLQLPCSTPRQTSSWHL